MAYQPIVTTGVGDTAPAAGVKINANFVEVYSASAAALAAAQSAQPSSGKNLPNGYAGLDSVGLLSSGQIPATSVLAGTYGDSTHVAQFAVGADGRITSAAAVPIAASGSGTVTSVSLALPSSLFSVVGSPVTGAGTLSATLQTQASATVWAGPATGAAAIPTFRALVATDIPTLNQSTTGNAATATALASARTINGVAFDGTANITAPAAAATLTGTTLAANVTTSSLTSAAGGAFGSSAYQPASAFEAPLTFGSGLSRSGNTVTATGGGGSALPVSTAFSQSVALDAYRYTPQQAVTGALTFTVAAGAVVGGVMKMRLVANGTNTPDFTAFRTLNGSSGWDNTSGVVNLVYFEYDGNDGLISIAQRVGDLGSDVVPPTAIGAAVANATPTVVNLTTSEAVDQTTTLRASDFTVSGHTISSMAFASSTQINATVSAAFTSGEAALTLSYTQPGTSINQIKDLSGNLMASFSGLAITNNVSGGGGGTNIRLSGLSTGTTESGAGPYGYSLTSSGGYANTSNLSLPPVTDGTFTLTITAAAAGGIPLFCLCATNTVTAFADSNTAYAIFLNGGNFYTALQDGGATYNGATNGPAGGTVAWAAGHLIKFQRVGTATTAWLSTNGGTSFTLLHTFSGTTTQRLYPAILQVNNTGTTTATTLTGVNFA